VKSLSRQIVNAPADDFKRGEEEKKVPLPNWGREKGGKIVLRKVEKGGFMEKRRKTIPVRKKKRRPIKGRTGAKRKRREKGDRIAGS